MLKGQYDTGVEVAATFMGGDAVIAIIAIIATAEHLTGYSDNCGCE